MHIKALATDLDGTLIPMDSEQQHALRKIETMLSDRQLSLVFVTGRHFASVRQAMEQHHLPQPDWVICDVGTTIFQRVSGKPDGVFQVADEYAAHLQELVRDCPATALIQRFSEASALRLQELEKQGPYKVSFYTDAESLSSVTAELQRSLDAIAAPWSIISSVDPFNGDGLIDLLPIGVSKSYAINWWANRHQLQPTQIVFAGDSGNDTAALTAGYLSIVVGNAAANVVESVSNAHQQSGWKDRFFRSQERATCGVMDGLSHFFSVLPSTDKT